MSALLAADPEALVELGRALFFDPILSIDRSIACASCHEPSHGFASTGARSAGVLGRETERNAQSLFNRALGKVFMWDGRAQTLEEQVLLPIENEREMGSTLAEVLQRLASDERRAAAFEVALGGPPSREGLARALSAFVRRLTLGDSPYDHFLAGRFDALSPEERGGLWIFESRGRCWRCHRPPLFTDEGFHATGVGVRDGAPEAGRMAVTHEESDLGRFKTPTLRGLLASAPYMHDGSLDTLEKVVERYRHIEPSTNLDPILEPLEITDVEAANLVAFLRVLSRRFEDGAR
jgi:cytochrome c peroxidase